VHFGAARVTSLDNICVATPSGGILRRKNGRSLDNAIKALGDIELDLRNLRGQGTTASLQYLRFISTAETSLAWAFVREDVEGLFHTPRFFELLRLESPGELMNRLVVGEIEARLEELSDLLSDMKLRRERLGQITEIVFVPDTNLFVHCNPFDELIWTELSGGAPVHIVVPLVVIEELDRLKRSGVSAVRQASRESLRRLESLGMLQAQSANLESATIEILEEEPYHLRAPTVDLEILETCSEINDASAGGVFVVTGDLSMIVRSRALGINALKVPIGWNRDD